METNNEEQTTKIKEKALVFFNNSISVHLIVLGTGRFFNGFIKEIRNNHLILIDEKLGWIPFFYNEIYDIKKREKKK